MRGSVFWVTGNCQKVLVKLKRKPLNMAVIVVYAAYIKNHQRRNR